MNSIVLLGILACCVSSVVCGTGPVAGGISETEKDAGAEVQGYVESLSHEIKIGASYSLDASGVNDSNFDDNLENYSLTALTYKTQLVAGLNYFVKLRLGEYIFHARIYRDLQGNLSLSAVKGPKKIEDSIEYF